MIFVNGREVSVTASTTVKAAVIKGMNTEYPEDYYMYKEHSPLILDMKKTMQSLKVENKDRFWGWFLNAYLVL